MPVKFKAVVADLGFSGVAGGKYDKEIIDRGEFECPKPQQKAWLRRGHAIDFAIGHLTSDHRMARCWLKAALHTVSV